MRTLLLSLLLIGSVVAQEIPLLVTSQAYQVQGVNDLVKIGDRVYLRSMTTVVKYKTVGLIRVRTNAANIVVEVEDEKCQAVKVDKVTDEYYEIVGPGTFKVSVTIFDSTKNIFDKESQTLTIEGENPPDPDDDDVDPDPVDPDPPTPPPIPETGLHMIIVYESADAARLTPGQREMFYSVEARKFYNKTFDSNWRVLDKDTVFQDSDNKWSKALKRPRNSLPWVIISNGVTGYEGKLPNNLSEFKGMVEIYK